MNAWASVALILLAAGATPAVATAADTDSTGSGLSGLYSSSADPDGYVLIHRMVSESQYQIHAGHRFISMGYLESDEYGGVLRTARPAGRSGPRHVGWLKFRREGDRLDVRWSEELGSAPTHTETWTLVSRFHKPTVADSTPALSESFSVDSMPQPIETTRPIYPPIAQRKGIEGSIMLQVLVEPDGRVTDIFVLKSIPELDAAAVAAVKEWRFRPAMAKGTPVRCWVTMPVRFKLR